MNQLEHIMSNSTGYLVDALGFETHMRQIRGMRGDSIPPEWYKRPYFYTLRLERDKMRGTGETLRFPSFVRQKDYEFELVAMHLQSIQTTDIREAIAHVRDHMVFSIFNDCSCRDFQADDRALALGVSASKGIADKGFGPKWAHGRDLNMDDNGVFHVGMKLVVNDAVRCETSFDSIYFDDPETGARRNWSFAQVIAWMGRMNQGFGKGDLLGSGTVGNGAIAERHNIHPWLRHGDEIVMRVEGLGELHSTVEVFDMPDPRKL